MELSYKFRIFHELLDEVKIASHGSNFDFSMGNNTGNDPNLIEKSPSSKHHKSKEINLQNHRSFPLFFCVWFSLVVNNENSRKVSNK
jgi:hypothetical protein